MDFATVKPTRKKYATNKLGGASAQRVNSAINAQAEAIADTRLRAQYQQAMQMHAAGNKLADARDLYDGILSHALLAPDRLHAAATVLTLPTRSDDEVAESASASHILVQRLMLRFLALKNRARLEEDEASAPATGAEDAAAKHLQLQHALELYLESLETGSSLARVEARVRVDRARAENGAAAAESKSAESPSIGAAAVASGSLVEDVSLWQRAAHVALRLDNFTLARQTLERAFILRSDLWPVIDSLEDVLCAASDFDALGAVTEHALRLDPWHLKSMILQHKVWAMLGEADSEPFALMETRLREQVDQATVEAVNRHLQSLHERYQQADVLEAASQPDLVIRHWSVVQPTFGALAEQIIRLYCELTESVPLAPAFTLLLREQDGKLTPTTARRVRHPLTTRIAVHVDGGKPAEAAAEQTAVGAAAAAPAPPKDSDEMVDEPVADSAAPSAAASAAASSMPVTPRTSSRVVAAPPSSTSSASAVSLPAATQSDEASQVHAFLREYASARQTSNGGWEVDCSSDLPTLAHALLQAARLIPSCVVENAALLCLITIVQANTALAETPSSSQLDVWLWCAEVAWEAHRLAFPALFPPTVPSVEVVDLTNSPAPMAVPFRAPRRWFSRHLSPIALADHFIGQILLAKAMGHTPANIFEHSSPQQKRWERLLEQRAMARQ